MPSSQATVTRFAPSPSGHLHLGHAFSALTAFSLAQNDGDRFILRIEDIDQGRCRTEFIDGIFEDLRWLGLSWEEPVRIQSEHMNDYREALHKLTVRGLVYPCFCTRKQILEEAARSGHAPHGPEGVLYPGTCRSLAPADAKDKQDAGESFALRLNMSKALDELTVPLTWSEEGRGTAGETGLVIVDPAPLGDVVLARKDTPTSYHLSVCVDDALQGVTLVARGQDLFHATHLHRMLQHLLELPEPRYHHHELIRDTNGNRLATRDKAMALGALRQAGKTPDDVRKMLDLIGAP